MMKWPTFEIIDISQPISPATACFPGDVAFSSTTTVDYATSQVINLTAFTMSPHVGTHADAPVHIGGSLETHDGTIGQVALSPFVGPVQVLDVSYSRSAITADQVRRLLEPWLPLPPRVLFKTLPQVKPNVWEGEYAHFSEDLVALMAEHKVTLMGLDTPSVDHVDAKDLKTHRALLNAGMAWLENLDLSHVRKGRYFLVALPLKLMTLEASPVRAVLLKETKPTTRRGTVSGGLFVRFDDDNPGPGAPR